MICIAIFSGFTFLGAFATTPTEFGTLRFLAGLGIGGVMPNVVALMTEYAPKRIRSTLVAIMFSGYAIGGMASALLGAWLVPTYGWKIMFYIASIPLFTLPLIWKFLPESLMFLTKKGETEQTRAIVQKIAPEQKLTAETTFVLNEATMGDDAPLRALFQQGRTFSTLMFWGAYFTGLFMVYALSTWLTKLMAMSGYTLGSALSFVIALNVGAVAGCIIGGGLADRFHIKWVLVCMYGLGSVFLYMMTLPMPIEVLYFNIGMVGACTTGAQIVAYAYCGQFYPSGIRATGIGMAAGIGRMGAILSPVLIGFIVALNLPIEQNFMVIAAAGLIGAVALSFINHNRSDAVLSSLKTTAKEDINYIKQPLKE